MNLCYQVATGDYLAIDTATNAYYLRNFAQDYFESRAAAIAGLVTSVCTTGIARSYLQKNCKRVPKVKMPDEWRKAIGL